MYHKYTGVILKKHPLGEADELLTIYTREVGKLRVKARSSRKVQSRLGGYLQSLNEIEFETVRSSGMRRSPAAGGGLPILISVRARALNNYLRENLKKFAYALVGIETLYRLTADEEESPQIYYALLKFLKSLGDSGDENLVVRKFQLELLRSSGYAFHNAPLSHHIPLSLSPLYKGEKEGDKRRGKLLLTPEFEKALDEFLQQVLERDIKSSRFLQALSSET